MSSPTTEMIERVAQVIGPMQDVCSPEDIARAALAAMREPASEQDAAFAATIDWMADTDMGRQQREAWRLENHRRWKLMIDAALQGVSAQPETTKPATSAATKEVGDATGSSAPSTQGG